MKILTQKEIDKRKARKVYQDWLKHLTFIRKNKPKEVLKYIYALLEEKRAFNYNWIARANMLAVEEVCKNE